MRQRFADWANNYGCANCYQLKAVIFFRFDRNYGAVALICGMDRTFRMPPLNVNRDFMRDLCKCSQKFAFRRTVQWTRGNNLSRVSIDPSHKMKIALHKIRIDNSRRTIEI